MSCLQNYYVKVNTERVKISRKKIINMRKDLPQNCFKTQELESSFNNKMNNKSNKKQ